MRMTTLRIIPVLLALFLAHAMGGEPKIAILGDSIPYSGQWPALVEAALRQAPAYRHAEIVSMALPSETVSGLSEPGHAGGAFPRPCLHDRLDSILSKYAPTLVIACYGMNDGMMQPFSESGFQAYQQGMERLKKRVEDSGAQFIAITPPPYMADTPEKDAARYNQVLDTYAAWLASRKKDGWKVVDMRPELGRQIREAKKRNPRFIYAGDGVPSRAGGPLHDCQGHLASPRLHPPRARPRPFSGKGRVQESPGAPQPVQAGVADGNGPPPPRHPEGGSGFRSSLHPGGSGRLGLGTASRPFTSR